MAKLDIIVAGNPVLRLKAKEVERAEYIECEFFDRKGKRMKLASDGILAIAVQHELDHLDGILFIDKATVLTPKETVPVGIE